MGGAPKCPSFSLVHCFVQVLMPDIFHGPSSHPKSRLDGGNDPISPGEHAPQSRPAVVDAAIGLCHSVPPPPASPCPHCCRGQSFQWAGRAGEAADVAVGQAAEVWAGPSVTSLRLLACACPGRLDSGQAHCCSGPGRRPLAQS